MDAAKYGNTLAVRILSCAGVDTAVVGDGQMTTRQYAVNDRDGDITKLLCEVGADIGTKNMLVYTPLMLGAHEGYTNIFCILCYDRSDIDGQSACGHTALSVGTEEGEAGAVLFLREAGADLLL